MRTFCLIIVLTVASICFLAACQARADSQVSDVSIATGGPGAADSIELSTGSSVVITTEKPIKRLSLASPDSADMLLLSPKQVYVTAKTPGATNLTIWGADEKIMAVYDLLVSPNVARLKSMLHRVLPHETEISVIGAGDAVTLSGYVSNSVNLEKALSLAQAVHGEGVVNLLRVGGVHQVLLEVRVAEVLRSEIKEFGFNLGYQDGGNIWYTLLGQLTSFDEQGKRLLSNAITAGGTYMAGPVAWSAYFQALQEEGVIKILAEPNLVCMSGQNANFLAGGEIPVPVPQGLGTVAIEWKPFGVGLTFTPTVLAGGRINLKVQPEVSELDHSIGVTLNTFEIPGVTTRRVSTTVELGSGQTFAIGGLIKDSLRESASKFPVLGNIPVLGALFRSSEFKKEQTELVVFVTPHLAKPIKKADQKAPTDNFREPTDFEFYMLGMIEGEPETPAHSGEEPDIRPVAARPSGFDGEFGHSLP